MGAALAAGGVSLLGGLAEGLFSSGGSKKIAESNKYAADLQRKSDQDAMFLQGLAWQVNRADMAPYREMGATAIPKYAEAVNKGPGEYTESPGYKFRLKEGENAIRNASAKKGWGTGGGEVIKNLMKYNQEVASEDYDKFRARWHEDTLNPLAVQVGIGQTMTSGGIASTGNTADTMTRVSQNSAERIGDLARDTGYANANAMSRWGNSINSGVNNALDSYLTFSRRSK